MYNRSDVHSKTDAIFNLVGSLYKASLINTIYDLCCSDSNVTEIFDFLFR